jgi:predicted AlkP superfamily pyrophosphatase or phosphodiesterase
MMKVVLILVDGMRPDALGEIPEAQAMKEASTHCFAATTVMPSVTLPCHMSLFHSVDPGRHGITTNTYLPQVRPVTGLIDQLDAFGRKCAFFYTWEELRDLTRPDSLTHGYYMSGHVYGYEEACNRCTDAAIAYLKENETDFTFLYLGFPDAEGHGYGWMSEKYMYSIDHSLKNMARVIEALGDDCQIILTADHGGHDRSHGYDIPEDMTIPVICIGSAFEAGKVLENVSIKDIAPTVTALLGVAPDPEWEGKNLLA